MKIIIPMAGHSRRFATCGYPEPKPFIKIDGHFMIQLVTDMFSRNNGQDQFYFIVQKSILRQPEYLRILQETAPECTIIGIEAHESGPIGSILAANLPLDDNEPVIVSYCDFYQIWNYPLFLRTVEHGDGAVVTFRGFQPASFGNTLYAYLRCNEKKEMLELKEKESFTTERHNENASTGVYYFSRFELLQKYAHKISTENKTVNGELYVSLLFNEMVREQLKVLIFEVDKFICLGTPEDVEQYRFWSEYFRYDLPGLQKK